MRGNVIPERAIKFCVVLASTGPPFTPRPRGFLADVDRLSPGPLPGPEARAGPHSRPGRVWLPRREEIPGLAFPAGPAIQPPGGREVSGYQVFLSPPSYAQLNRVGVSAMPTATAILRGRAASFGQAPARQPRRPPSQVAGPARAHAAGSSGPSRRSGPRNLPRPDAAVMAPMSWAMVGSCPVAATSRAPAAATRPAPCRATPTRAGRPLDPDRAHSQNLRRGKPGCRTTPPRGLCRAARLVADR